MSGSLWDTPIRPIRPSANIRPILVKQQSICSSTSASDTQISLATHVLCIKLKFDSMGVCIGIRCAKHSKE